MMPTVASKFFYLIFMSRSSPLFMERLPGIFFKFVPRFVSSLKAIPVQDIPVSLRISVFYVFPRYI